MVVGVIGFDCDHLGRWSRLGAIKCIRFHLRFDPTEVDKSSCERGKDWWR